MVNGRIFLVHTLKENMEGRARELLRIAPAPKKKSASSVSPTPAAEKNKSASSVSITRSVQHSAPKPRKRTVKGRVWNMKEALRKKVFGEKSNWNHSLKTRGARKPLGRFKNWVGLKLFGRNYTQRNEGGKPAKKHKRTWLGKAKNWLEKKLGYSPSRKYKGESREPGQ